MGWESYKDICGFLIFFLLLFFVSAYLGYFSHNGEKTPRRVQGRGKKILLFQQNGVGFFANHDSPLSRYKTDDEWMNGRLR